MTAQNVSVGDGSLSSVVSAINAANVGVTANALQVGTNQYALEVSSQNTGTAGAATFDAQAFAGSSLGALQTTTAAQNAIVSVGGVGGFQVTSPTNAVTGLLPGVTVDLQQVSASPVTLTVSADGSQVASQVSALVSAANAGALHHLDRHGLQPVHQHRGAAQRSDLAQPAGAAGAVHRRTGRRELGRRVRWDGRGIGRAGPDLLGHDHLRPERLRGGLRRQPGAVQAMFTEGGTFAPASPASAGQVSVAGASNNTVPGNYAVTISQSAAQAVDTGSATFAAQTSVVGAAESYTVTSGSLAATYAVSAGESVANVISGLNGALAAAGIRASASLTGSAGLVPGQAQLGRLRIGRRRSASVRRAPTNSGSPRRAAPMRAPMWSGPSTASPPPVRVRSSRSPTRAIRPTAWCCRSPRPVSRSSTSLGTVDYAPGMAQGLANLAEQATIAPGGQLPVTISGLQSTLVERDGPGRAAKAAGEHPAGDADPGVHQSRGDAGPAFLREPVPDRLVGRLVGSFLRARFGIEFVQ